MKNSALASSLLIGVVNIIAIYQGSLATVSSEVTIHWLTILLFFLAGTSMLSDTLKETPLETIVAIFTIGALTGLMLFFADQEGVPTNVGITGIGPFPLWLVILVIVGLVAIVFIVSFFTDFTLDKVLQIFSWSPIITLFCGLLFLQGLFILIESDPSGIWDIFTELLTKFSI